MNETTFNNISKIVERESKTTTYKFALLRGVVDIIQENTPYSLFKNTQVDRLNLKTVETVNSGYFILILTRFKSGENKNAKLFLNRFNGFLEQPVNLSKNNQVYFPIGLLIEKWMLYYYPILESATKIPQINGEVNLAFEIQFKKIILEYSNSGGFSAFYNDLKSKGIPQNLKSDFIRLEKSMKNTITQQPMKYMGSSISNNHYSIFQFESKSKKTKPCSVDAEYLISSFGLFSIPLDYYDAFKVLGSFINGRDSILFINGRNSP